MYIKPYRYGLSLWLGGRPMGMPPSPRLYPPSPLGGSWGSAKGGSVPLSDLLPEKISGPENTLNYTKKIHWFFYG